MIYQGEIQLQTSGHREMHDLTDDVARVMSESRVRCGLVHILNVGSTACIGAIEFEPGLKHDLPALLKTRFDSGHEVQPPVQAPPESH